MGMGGYEYPAFGAGSRRSQLSSSPMWRVWERNGHDNEGNTKPTGFDFPAGQQQFMKASSEL
jgi:hypothetical protein